MEIEKKLHSLENDPKFREMQSNLKILESTVVGSRHVRICSPDNMDQMIELRRNSNEMDDIIKKYRDGLERYQTRIDQLNREKNQLQKELFPIK